MQRTEARTVTIPEAARLLGLSREGAYRLAKRGELPGAIRLGGRIVVSREVLERLLAGKGTDGRAAP